MITVINSNHTEILVNEIISLDNPLGLGSTLDCHLTMNAHVSNIARTCYFELRRLASICRFLKNATATLVSASVL